ncbi:Stf0 family sulfotransferase [Planktothrix agardhii]|uniref:Stf0 family sulfotransferase n=1 Tax=Planktothrix agardhii TaxID=1160 RepID=UPI0020A7CCE3|nr:Stf0 family sulfotransferase [Planktothrix agardhii]CAD5946489.1 hypothetical protein NO365_02268 [Planktothrix agardhii]
MFDVFNEITETVKEEVIDKKPKSLKNYIICFTERCGSTMLCSLIKETNLLGMPDEYINPRGVVQTYLKKYPAKDVFQYFDLLRRNQVTNDIFGMKTCFYDLNFLLERGIVGELLSPVKFIYMTRHNVIQQAISSYRARKSNIWHLYKNRSISSEQPVIEYDELAILSHVESRLKERLQWENFFTLYSVNPLRITYEDVLENPQKVLQKIANFVIGEDSIIDIDLTMADTEKVTPLDVSQAWADKLQARFKL